jgi:hypothetical protein
VPTEFFTGSEAVSIIALFVMLVAILTNKNGRKRSKKEGNSNGK